jgi:arylformamidase
MTEAKWIDITLPLGNEIPVMSADSSAGGETEMMQPVFDRVFDVNKGDPVNMAHISIDSHIGTHIDSPFHFIPDGTTIDLMPIETTVGPARVIEIENDKEITIEELEPHNIGAGDRILFKTKNSPGVYATQPRPDQYVSISPKAAKYLADKKIRLVGLDYLTIASSSPKENINITHRAFLDNGIYIIEGLNMDGVEPGDYELVCLPLRLEKGDAGPCRAVIRSLK